MERDRRLTGTLRGQTDKPEAPAGFEFSNGWRVCSAYFIQLFPRDMLMMFPQMEKRFT